MRNKYAKKKQQNKEIALERISILFKQADEWKNEQTKANNCVKLARKLSLKYKVPFSKAQKLRFCRKCNSFLTPGLNSRTRVTNGKIIVYCEKCKNYMRFLYK